MGSFGLIAQKEYFVILGGKSNRTICKFNTGVASRLPILEAVGVKPYFNMLAAFRREDKLRINVN